MFLLGMIMLGCLTSVSSILLIMGIQSDKYTMWDVVSTTYLWVCFITFGIERILF